MSSKWRTCTKSNRCPVCVGNNLPGDHYCSVTDDDTCCQCSHSKRKGSVLPAPAGWEMWKATEGGGMLYRALGPDGKAIDVPKETEADRQRREEQEAFFKQRGIDNAKQIYRAALQKQEWRGAAEAYLRARGIDVSRLPGGVLPKAVQFDPQCIDGTLVKGVTKAMSQKTGEAVRQSLQMAWPAMVCGVADENGELQGVHRTFMGLEWKRPEAGASTHTAARHTILNEQLEYELVDRVNGSWRVVPRKRTDDELPDGLILKDDKGRDKRGTWTGLGANKKMLGECLGNAVRLGREFPGGVLMLGEGLENTLAAMQATGWTGFALLSENGVRSWKLPEGLFARGLPTSISRVIILQDLEYGKSFKPGDGDQSVGAAAGGILANRILTAFPWLIVQRAIATHENCPELVAPDGRPILEKGKSVGWLDVLNASGEEAVKRAIVNSPVFGGDGPTATLAPVPPSDLPGGTRADGSTLGGAGGGVGSGGVGAGGGGGGAGDGENLYRPADWHTMPIIADGPVNQARRFLVEQCLVPGADRFGLVRWGTKWWWYAEGAYRELDDERLRSIVWQWLQGFRRMHRDKPVAFNPDAADAEAVCKALAIDCVVNADSIPVWLPPSIIKGQVQWGLSAMSSLQASETRVVDGPDGKQVSKAPMNLVFPNGVLDVGEVCRTKKVRLKAHSPELFTTTKFPYELPVEDLQEVIDAKSVEEADAVYQRLAPRFFWWLMDTSTHDPEGDCDRAWIQQLQLMLGDTVTGDRTLEKIFMAVGIKRSGKGLIGVILETVLGSENLQALNGVMLMDKYGTSAMVGKVAALWPDAHVQKFDDGGPIVETLKSIRGRDRLPIRDLYSSYTTARIGARIWITANTMVDLRDDSGAFAGSLVVLPMRKSAEGREDETLKDDLRTEGPGLMSFALAGAVALANLKRRHIAMCDDGEDVQKDFARASAHIDNFVRECIVIDKRDEVSMLKPDDAYKAYCWYCETLEKRQPKGRTAFFREVQWLMPKYTQPRQLAVEEGVRVVRRDRVWPGCRLTDDARIGANGVGMKSTSYGPAAGAAGEVDVPLPY